MYASRRMRFQVHMQIDQKLLPELLRASSNYYISVPLWFEVRRPKECCGLNGNERELLY